MSETTETTGTAAGSDPQADAAIQSMLNDADDTTGGVEGDASDSDDSADELSDSDADELGDKGKQALDRMKAKLKAERVKRLAAEQRANASASEDEAAKIRREAETAATAKANSRIVKAEIRAAAAGKLQDPMDALAFLNSDDFEVDEDGAVDAEEIADAIADLLRRKPHLAAQGGSTRPKPDRSQGAAGKGTASTDQLFANALKGAF